MIINIILLIIGFVILIKGADLFVDGASSIALNLKLSKMLIGLTIVSFGTSAPEFAVSVTSLLNSQGDIVLGNVIGSNILNILLILGVSSMFHSLNVKNATVKKEIPITILFTSLLFVLISDNLFGSGVNKLTRSDGIIIILFFMIFIYYLITMMRNKVDDNEEVCYGKLKSVIYTLIGIIAIIIGSNFVVRNASSIATVLGVSERMIALTIVALGTSLPELVTSVTATKKGEYDIAIGNVVGSNIFNIGIVLGVPVALFGEINNISIQLLDIIIMIISAVLLFIFSVKDHKINKKEGIIFLMIFVIYYGYIILGG